MQMQQSAMAAQRSAAMAGVASRSGMPHMQNRPTPTQGQMMASGPVRPQAAVQQQQATAYTRTARNMPPNNPVDFQVQLLFLDKNH